MPGDLYSFHKLIPHLCHIIPKGFLSAFGRYLDKLHLLNPLFIVLKIKKKMAIKEESHTVNYI